MPPALHPGAIQGKEGILPSGNHVTRYTGGGGGGVLVDGQGPVRLSDRVGEGYGGGGSAEYGPVPSLPGAVILDFVPEQ